MIGLDKLTLTQLFNTRLDEAKKHLICQIKNLISQNRIDRLGLITFNGSARVNISLTSNFKQVINGIQNQRASGTTALYDSIVYAQK